MHQGNINKEINTIRLPIFGFGKEKRPDKVTRHIGFGKASGGSIEVIGASGLGVPLAKDYDVYLAVLSLIPAGADEATFDISEVIDRLSAGTGGRVYDEVRESLSRLRATTILFRRSAYVKGEDGAEALVKKDTVETSLFEEVRSESYERKDGKVVTTTFTMRLSRFFAGQVAAKYYKSIRFDSIMAIKGPAARRLWEILDFMRNGRDSLSAQLETVCDMLPVGGASASKRRETLKGYLAQLAEAGAVADFSVSGQKVDVSFPSPASKARTAASPAAAAVLAAAAGLPDAEALARIAERSGKPADVALSNLRAARAAHPRNLPAYYSRALAEDFAAKSRREAAIKSSARSSAVDSAAASAAHAKSNADERAKDRIFNAVLDSLGEDDVSALFGKYGIDRSSIDGKFKLRIAMKRDRKFDEFVRSAR